MASLSADPPPDRQVRSELLSSVLSSYAQIFFRGSPMVGAILLVATWLDPTVGIVGTAAVVAAVAVARLGRLSPELIRDGLFGYNALLVGLGTASLFGFSGASVSLALVGAMATVPLTAAAHSLLWGTFGLPPLTVPFLLAFYIVAGAAPALGLGAGALEVGADRVAAWLPGLASEYLTALGAIFFLPMASVGIVVLIALATYSRIAVFLTVVGFAVAQLLETVLVTGPIPPVVVGYNLMLTAVALGGVWFVPSWSALVFAAASAALCGLFTVGVAPYLGRAGLPTLILPFNLTVLAMLYAMRQRLADERPKAVDFLIGSPEENAMYHWTRQARFGAHYAVQFRLPCRGRWVCTQGTDGDVTHRGAWRHAVDLEVEADSGRVFHGAGDQLSDYAAYGLPVTASAPGTVVKTVDSVRDNPVGRPNLHQNWGNLVLIQHGPHLYSMTCHLQPGSVCVRPGQIVDTGDPIGACGNSGRSSVPHIHFQLQGSARVGDPTLMLELHDVVRVAADGEHLEAAVVPAKGDRLRNPTRDDDVAALFEFEWGVPLDFVIEPSGRRERLRYDIDLLGRRYLTSEATGAKLYFESRPTTFTVFDVVGGAGSALPLIRDALPRAPLEGDERLDWIDYLPRRGRSGPVLRTLGDFILPFVPPRSGGRMRYGMRRHDGAVWIEGRAVDGGRSDFATRARLERGRGLVRVEVDCAGETTVARRVDAEGEVPAEPEPARERAREEIHR